METDDPSLRVLSLAQHEAFSFLQDLDRAPVGATVDVQTLRQQLNKPGNDTVRLKGQCDCLVSDAIRLFV